MIDPLVNRLRAFHDRNARVILAGIAALIVPMMALTLVATLDNWRQDNERDALLECFNQFATDSSSSSIAVRKASMEKDQATSERDDALAAEGKAFLHLSRKILKRNVTEEDFQALVDSLDDRARASRKLDRAQEHLDEVRADNPVPPPPSEFCAD